MLGAVGPEGGQLERFTANLVDKGYTLPPQLRLFIKGNYTPLKYTTGHISSLLVELGCYMVCHITYHPQGMLLLDLLRPDTHQHCSQGICHDHVRHEGNILDMLRHHIVHVP